MRVLCIDTEPETIAYLRAAGVETHSVRMGYQAPGQRSFFEPPHEYDLIACDLKRPACYDNRLWGRANNNYHVEVVPPEAVTDEVFLRGVPPMQKPTPRFRLVDEDQIDKSTGAPFGPGDVLAAIAVAGVPALLFLNGEWLDRTTEFPPFFGLGWHVTNTRATLVQRDPLLSDTFPELGPGISMVLPLRYILNGQPRTEIGGRRTVPTGVEPPLATHPPIEAAPLVTNVLGEVFAQYVTCGNGSVWALPPTENNAEIIRVASERLDRLNPPPPSQNEQLLRRPAPRTITAGSTASTLAGASSATYDVFISHASEDKAVFVQPLAEALRGSGLNVWYDAFALTVGDSLRKKIDEGLASSRFGIVVLSRAFFSKRWPQAELDAMADRHNSQPGKYLLPIWHEVGLDDVRRESPLLSGLLAARSIDGLDVVVQQLLESIRPA